MKCSFLLDEVCVCMCDGINRVLLVSMVQLVLLASLDLL